MCGHAASGKQIGKSSAAAAVGAQCWAICPIRFTAPCQETGKSSAAVAVSTSKGAVCLIWCGTPSRSAGWVAGGELASREVGKRVVRELRLGAAAGEMA